jgi:hypothetical protein
MIIGVDLDNTIVSYDALYHRLALENGLIPQGIPISKQAVRGHIWKTVGDLPWQHLQAEVYGPRMAEAKLIPGAYGFFRRAGRTGAAVFIISHKTIYARRDHAGTNLHRTAMDWLTLQGFFDDPEIHLAREDVFFEATREEKIRRIRALGCQIHIDDLEEVLVQPDLDGIRRIRLGPDRLGGHPDITYCSAWKAIEACVFG